MKTLTLQLSDDTAQRLEVLAEKLGVSPEEIVRAGQGRCADVDRVLSKVPDVEPDVEDRL